MSKKRVFFYVQHLLGIGHQRRGATLARAMEAAGMEVTYVSGGTEIPNLNLGGGKLVCYLGRVYTPSRRGLSSLDGTRE